MTIGGYDPRDIIGNFQWFDFPANSWNMTHVHAYIGDKTLDTYTNEEGEATLMFQTGYPYIGLPDETFHDILNVM